MRTNAIKHRANWIYVAEFSKLEVVSKEIDKTKPRNPMIDLYFKTDTSPTSMVLPDTKSVMDMEIKIIIPKISERFPWR